mmetsp:Transcript_14636/g.17094  ORF Transcript_14636/g.17094 Transcript_14636/m.17094 type:complete len:94 (-) Transcript_14636:3628-3909(-)
MVEVARAQFKREDGSNNPIDDKAKQAIPFSFGRCRRKERKAKMVTVMIQEKNALKFEFAGAWKKIFRSFCCSRSLSRLSFVTLFMGWEMKFYN